MSKVSVEKKPYGLKILDSLLTPSSKEEEIAIDLALRSKELDGFIPVFFYRHPIYSVKIRAGITLFRNYSIQMDYSEWRDDDRARFEYILSRAEYKGGVLSAKFVVRDVIERFNLDYQVFFEGFCNIRIKISDGIRHKSFPLFDGFYSDDRTTGTVEIIFSRDMKKLYASDFMVNPVRFLGLEKPITRLEKSGFFRSLLRFICTINAEPGRVTIPLRGESMENFGLFFDAATINLMQKTFSSQAFHSENCFVAPLAAVGVGFFPSTQSFSYRKHYIAPELPTIFVDKYDDKKVIAQLKKSLPAIEGASENGEAVGEEYIVFSTLELSDKILNVARTKGYSLDEATALFSTFKIKYADKEYEYKRTSLSRVWGAFLKKHEEFKEERKTPNSGSPENIVYNEELIEQSNIFGFSPSEAEVLFGKFQRDYLSKGTRRKNWVPVWITWLENDKAWKSKKGKVQSQDSKSWQVKQSIENRHYLAKLISEGIKKMLSAQGVSAYDVIKGKYIVTDVEFDNVPIPPAGKHTEVIFSFKDKSIQQRAIDEVTGNPESNKIETYVEASIIEGSVHE